MTVQRSTYPGLKSETWGTQSVLEDVYKRQSKCRRSQTNAQGCGFAGNLSSAISAHAVIPQSIAWRLFTKGIDRESARGG